MTELQRILASLTTPGVLATVVNVEGSAYRRPGARMFVRKDGESVGTISGGCLESDVIERGWSLTENNRPALIRYDSRGEDDTADWGFGLGCNGAIDVLLERIDPAKPPHYLHEIRRALDDRRSLVLATVFARTSETSLEIGSRVVVDGPDAGEDDLHIAAGQTLAARKSSVQNIAAGNGQASVFFELIDPSPHLLVCGAGHDALPLVRLASVTGWSITVCDRRAALANKDRFPQADAVYAVPPEQTLAALASPPDAVVIMTHRFPEDGKLLGMMLDSPAAYVGVLGPRHRTDRLLRAANVDSFPTKLHAPVGLDLGSETPEEIALSILSEATAVLRGRVGGKLRDSEQPIHHATADRPLRIADSIHAAATVGS